MRNLLTNAGICVTISLMKMFEEKLLGGDYAEQLPTTRRAAFAFYGKQQFWKLLLCGAFTSLFFAPLLVWLYAMNYARAQAVAALDPTAADYAVMYGQLLVGWSLKTYLVSVPLVALFFVGLAGLFALVKRICFYQSSNYREYFVGIAHNWLHFALWGMLFGISLFFLRFNITYYTVSGFSPVAKGLLAGFAVVQFVLVAVATMYFVTGDVTYRYTLWQSIKNAFLLTFNGLFKNLLFAAIGFAPFVIALFVPSPFQTLLLAVAGLVYPGFLSLLWTTYCQGVYDKAINPQLGAEYVGKGLAKRHGDGDSEKTV